MAHEIVMPQLSLSMDKGQISRWLKQTGDKINIGDILLEVESDKATVEVEAIENGILQIVLGPDSGEVPVGAVIAYLRAENEAAVVPPATILPTATKAIVAERTVVAPPIGDNSQQRQRRLPSSPAARRKAAELNVDWQRAMGTGRAGRIKERDVIRFAQESAQSAGLKAAPIVLLQLTPVARRIADDFGLTDALLATLITGKNKLERDDVEQAIRQLVRERAAKPQSIEPPRPSVPAPAALRRQPLGTVRKRIVERMTLSEQTYTPVTLTTEVDATELVRLREVVKADPHTTLAPSYNVLLAKIAAKALSEHPDLNASLDGNEIVYWPTINIGVAVDTERGLVVPVVRDVAAKSVSDLARDMDELLKRAVQGKATPDELTGGTFTITNLGVYDIDAFTPIINPPECAVLGVGRLRKQMLVISDQPTVRTLLVLSLTFDHRLVDGAPAARFLQRIKQLCEQPYLWLS